MSTPVKVTKEQIRRLIAKAGRRYRGEPPQFRFGYICALHDIAEDDGDEMKCDHFETRKSRNAFYKLIGKDYEQVKNS